LSQKYVGVEAVRLLGRSLPDTIQAWQRQIPRWGTHDLKAGGKVVHTDRAGPEGGPSPAPTHSCQVETTTPTWNGSTDGTPAGGHQRRFRKLSWAGLVTLQIQDVATVRAQPHVQSSARSTTRPGTGLGVELAGKGFALFGDNALTAGTQLLRHVRRRQRPPLHHSRRRVRQRQQRCAEGRIHLRLGAIQPTTS